MRLTRRDAVAALSGAGIVVGGGIAALSRESVQDDADGSGDDIDRTLATLTAAAEVVYPSDIDGIGEFVETYSLGRIEGRKGYLADVRQAVSELNETTLVWENDRFAALSVEVRDSVLRQLGVDTADEDPEGTTAERIRYYIINELLFALYASPTGGELVGIENPQGYPGGTGSYQRGPR